MNKKSLLILQIAWIAIGLMCLFAAVHNKVYSTGERTLLFSLMGLASFVMAYFRHIQRKKG